VLFGFSWFIFNIQDARVFILSLSSVFCLKVKSTVYNLSKEVPEVADYRSCLKTDKIGYFFDICCNSMAKWLVGVLDEWWPLIYCKYFMNTNYFYASFLIVIFVSELRNGVGFPHNCDIQKCKLAVKIVVMATVTKRR
jgi:hypothetical protein